MADSMTHPFILGCESLSQDQLNAEVAKSVRWAVDPHTMEDPHTKANLLLQLHFGRGELPSVDYLTDTKSVMDQAIRVLQAMVDVSAQGGWLHTTLHTMHLQQMVLQGLYWDKEAPMGMLPHMGGLVREGLEKAGFGTLPLLLDCPIERLQGLVRPKLTNAAANELVQVSMSVPFLFLEWFFFFFFWICYVLSFSCSDPLRATGFYWSRARLDR